MAQSVVGRYGGTMQAWRARLAAAVAARPLLAKVASNAGWLVLDRVFRMGVGVLISVWIARHLGPEDFGALNWMLALAGMFFALTTVGLNEIMVRELVRAPDDEAELLGTAFAMQLTGGLIGTVIMLGLVMFLRPGDAASLWLALAVVPTLLAQSSDVVRYHYEARLESRYTVWVANAAFLTVTLVRIVLLVLGAPMIAFAIVTAAEMVLAGLGMFAVYIWQGRRRRGGEGLGFARWTARWERVRALLAMTWPLLLSSTAVVINMRIDAVMLGELSDDVAVGIYSAAVRISEMWYFLPMVIASSVFPTLVALHGKDAVAEAVRWRQIYALLLWLGISAGVVASLLADWGVLLLYGEAYRDAGPVLALHIWGGVMVCVGLVWSKWLLLEGRQTLILYNQVLGAVLNVGFNLWLIPTMGVIGAAVATLLSYSLSMLSGALSYRPRVTFGHLWAALRPWTLRGGQAGA